MPTDRYKQENPYPNREADPRDGKPALGGTPRQLDPEKPDDFDREQEIGTSGKRKGPPEPAI